MLDVMYTGMYSQSFKLRIQHACDALLALETLSDDSALYQLLPDAARWVLSFAGQLSHVLLACWSSA